MCSRTKHMCACLALELYSSAPLERYVVLAFCMQYGAGLYIKGTATLINSAIYQNEATVGVQLLNLRPTRPSQTFAPAPR